MGYDVLIGRNESDKKLFEKKGTLFIGKTYVKMGQHTSMSNRILMDIARSHVLLIAGKRGCLTGDTLVFTNHGYKKIQNFNEKENKILSFNKKTKKFEWEKAELLKYPIKNEELIEIKFDNNKKLKLTNEHPLLKDENGKLVWKKAHNLKKGDKIISTTDKKNINSTLITKLSYIRGIQEVYDLSIDKNHSFIANGIISHNSGKSYTMGVIAEEISNLPKDVSQNIASLMFDTMGIYWTMKFRNEKDKELLKQWDLKPKELPVKVFVPFGYYDDFVEKGIPVDKKFALDPSEMSAEDWILTFNLNIINPVAILIERTIYNLKEKKSKIKISEIIKAINENENEKSETKKAAIALFEATLTWGIFAQEDQKPTKVSDLITRGTTSVLDLSVYNSVGSFNVRALVISLVSRKLFNQRMMARKLEEIKSISKGANYLKGSEKKDVPIVWLFIDECHEFLPKTGKTLATDALVQLLREGRQPGISLVLATQQPGQIHHDVMTQSDLVLSHRVTSKQDLEALNYIMQSYVLNSVTRYLNDLPDLKGSAIILDDNSERIYPMRMRPRFTWHGGEAPTSISVEDEL